LIARQHDVLVDVDQIEGLTPTDPPATNDRKVEQGRLVAALTAADAEPSAVLRLTPNEPRLHGTLATRFTREADGWYLTVDGRLDALDGPIDRLRFDVPAAWADALDEDAGVSCHPGALPDHTRKRLTVWLSEAATGPFQVELRGRVATAAGQRVEAPNVRLLDGDEVRQILILPTRAETQQIAWETRYLRSSELPEPFLSESGSQRGLACYEVMLPRYRAVLQSVQTASGVPQVRLADMRITWRDNRRVFGRAAFDLEPAGLTHCYVEMPEGCQPLWSSAAELPGDLQPRGERLWLLSLHTEQLPQRIEIVFSGRIGDDAPRGHEIAFEAPTLRDAQMLPLPVERTLWTIWGPAAAGHGAPVEGGAVVDPLRQQMYRLRSTAALIDLASSVVTDHAAVEVQRWYVPWARRMIEAHRAAARLTPRDDATLSEGERILQQQATIAQRLGTSQSLAEMLRQPAAGGEPAGVHVTAAASSRPPVRCMYRGAAGRLVVRYPDAPQGNLAWRLATAVALLIGTVAACPVWVRSWCGERCRRWPHAAGVLIGVASWLLLWPSLFGWAIIVVCLAASLRTGRRVAGSGEGSTMLRSVEPPQS